MLLKALLQDYAAQIQLLGEADGGLAAVELIEKYRPQVVFLDIQMPDLNGFEVLQRLSYTPKIVFVTAFDEYALRAFEENTVDYLLKPVAEKRLAITMAKILEEPAPVQHTDQNAQDLWIKNLISHMQGTMAAPQKLAVKNGAKILLVAPEEIAWVAGGDKYSTLHSLAGKQYLSDHTLTELETMLPPAFLRVQKSAIVNTSHIAELVKDSHNRLLIKLTDQPRSELLSGTAYIQQIRERLKL